MTALSLPPSLPPSLSDWLLTSASLSEWFWKCVLRAATWKAVSVALFIVTVMVVWSECVFFVSKPPLSLFALFIKQARSHFSYVSIEVGGRVIIVMIFQLTLKFSPSLSGDLDSGYDLSLRLRIPYRLQDTRVQLLLPRHKSSERRVQPAVQCHVSVSPCLLPRCSLPCVTRMPAPTLLPALCYKDVCCVLQVAE